MSDFFDDELETEKPEEEQEETTEKRPKKKSGLLKIYSQRVNLQKMIQIAKMRITCLSSTRRTSQGEIFQRNVLIDLRTR